MPLRVTVWHEYRHEKKHEAVRALYPDGMHATLKSAIEENLGAENVQVTLAALDDDEHGLPDDVMKSTDVMVWWGHGYHAEVRDDIAYRVAERVRNGMGLVVLHSGHYSKPFKLLLGTGGHLSWREAGEKERVWCVAPGHPITAGLADNHFDIPHEEMYGEPFDIPAPDELVFVSWFEGGEVFRSGCVWRRGAGRIFYFRPGHESFPTYHQPEVRRVVANGVAYVAPVPGTVAYREKSPNVPEPLSPISTVHVADEGLHHSART